MMPALSSQNVQDAAFLVQTSYISNDASAIQALESAGWNGLVDGNGRLLFSVNNLDLEPYFSDANVFAAIKNGVLAIVFEGSGTLLNPFDWDDWVSNFGGGIVSWAPLYNNFSGFFAAVDAFLDAHPGMVTQVLVTGHSQGGALAEYYLSQHTSSLYTGVTFASPGIGDPLNAFGTDRLIRIEHTDDIVVDAAQEVIGSFRDLENDLRISRPEGSVLGIAEHSINLYKDSVERIFSSAFSDHVLQYFESIRPVMLSDVGPLGGIQRYVGGPGVDYVFGGDWSDNIAGGGSIDYLAGGDGFDDLRGEDGSDHLDGGRDADILYGGPGDDVLNAGNGGLGGGTGIASGLRDRLFGEAERDTLYGSEYGDDLYGGEGNDELYGGGGNDLLRGEAGNDHIQGGEGTADVAAYSNDIARYWIEYVDVGTYRLAARDGDEGVDTLIQVERLQFGGENRSIDDWLTIQNGTITPPVEPPPVVAPPPTPGPTTSSLLSVTPVDQTLRVGQSVALEAIFPQSGWIDNDGPRDIRWVYVQDRTVGHGYLTNNGVAMNAGTVYTVSVADLSRWRFMAGSGPGTDELGFNVVQADGDYSPRLNPGALVTTLLASTVTPPLDDHGDGYASATVVSSEVVAGFVSASGTIGTASDKDWFSVQLQAGKTYAFVLSPNITTRSRLDPRLTLRTPSGQAIVNDNLSATTLMSFIGFTATQNGTYRLQAEGVGGTTGAYILTVSPIATDPTANGLTQQTGSTDSTGSISWHWEGTANDDTSTESKLEAGGRPQTSANNFYRGHDGDDRIRAGGGNDVVWGDDDDDLLYGEDGNDVLRGGRDDDTLYGDDGNDLLYGEDGDDNLRGGDDGDTLYGGDDEDDLNGNDGSDYLKGEDGDDDLNGGAGDDQLYGDQGDDVIQGVGGNDFLMGGRGNDSMDGGSEHDRLAGEDGDDYLDGDDGDDALYGGDDDDRLQGREGNDILHGEDGVDTADFRDGNDGVRINLFDEIAVSTDLGTDRLYDIENIVGSAGDDVVDGDHGVNVLDGYAGSDNVRGHNGNDTLLGGAGSDTLWGDTGDDVVSGDADDDEVRGGLGRDTLQGGSGNDRLRGEQGDDTVDGGEGVDTAFFWGEREDFAIVASGSGVEVADLRADGQEGRDLVTNVEWFEFFDGTASAAALLEGPPEAVADEASTTAQTPIVLDVLQNDRAGAGVPEILSVEVTGGGGVAYVAGNQVVFDPRGAFGNMAPESASTVVLSYLMRSAGLLTARGEVRVTVTSDRDRMAGDGSSNELNGYEGDDVLSGGGGDDRLSGGPGNDTLDGGDGIDTASYGDAFAGVRVKLATAGRAQRTTGAGIDTLSNLENLSGSMFADSLTGDANANVLLGGAGRDQLSGGGGIDTMDGGEDGDTYTIDADIVHDTGSTGVDTAIATRSTTLASDSGVEILKGKVGSTGNLTLTGNELDNRLIGNDGNNALRGLAGADSLYGGLGYDRLEGGTGRDNLAGEDGADTFIFKVGDSAATATTFDIVADFLTGVDRIDLDTVGPGGLPLAAYAEASAASDTFNAARSAALTAMAGGAFTTAFVAGTTVGWLFWSTDGNNTTIEQAARLNGANTLAAFDRADLI